MITENNVVPLFGIPLCKTKIRPYEESEDFIKTKLEYEIKRIPFSWTSRCSKWI